MGSQLTQKIIDYIQSRANKKILELDKSMGDQKDSIEYIAKRKNIDVKYQPKTWLSDAANRAKQITAVTHAAKYTHTDAEGSSLRAMQVRSDRKKIYLSTNDIKKPELDIVGNAAALDVAALMCLETENTSLLECIEKGDSSALKPFSDDAVELEKWLHGFQKALSDSKLSSDGLSKQLYFPVTQDVYHLIGPLFASTLAQEIYTRIQHSKFSEKSKELRKAKKEHRAMEGILEIYPNLAVQTFGGAKKQNVSKLNVERYGKVFLLSSQPPIWQHQKQPPIKYKKQFWKIYERQSKDILIVLIQFLQKVTDYNNVNIRNARAELINQLIDVLLSCAAEIQSFSPGWSLKSKLSRAENLWLDPCRDDLGFQEERNKNNWQDQIATQFADWLNNKLRKKLSVGDTEFTEWKKTAKYALTFDDRS